jgi:hypothetical protein
MAKSVTVRKFAILLGLSALGIVPTWAQMSDIPTPPQTARQALIEMFSSKTPGTFIKHLPAATLNALEKSGALAALLPYSMMAGQFQTKAKKFETFEAGPVILAVDSPENNQRVEITVENDSLQGDEDDIELSFQTYKDQQPQRTGFMPRMIFAMKMESGVWKLNEIRFTIRVPLADPDFLKSITEGMKSRAASIAPLQIQGQTSTNALGMDASVLAAMRTILTAEATYSVTYPSVGFTCTLSDLDGFGGGEANQHQAMLIASGLASGKKYGYTFTLSGCAATPATSFHLVAAPVIGAAGGNNFGRRAFCADQSRAIRYSADGNTANCLAGGIPAQ